MEIKMIKFNHNGSFILNDKDEYRINRINKIWAVQLSKYDQIKRLLLLALSFSSVGGVFAYWAKDVAIYLVLILFCVGLLWALLTFRRYELRVEFKATDETGVQTVTLMHALKVNKFESFKSIAKQLSMHIQPIQRSTSTTN